MEQNRMNLPSDLACVSQHLNAWLQLFSYILHTSVNLVKQKKQRLILENKQFEIASHFNINEIIASA